MENESQTLNAAALAMARAVFYIGLTIFAITWLLSSDLDSDTIELCREACTSASSTMESVTSSECICESSAGWVLPR